MDLGDELIGVGSDDRKRPNPLTRAWLLPILPNTGDPEWRAVLHGDGIGLLGPLSLDGLPLEEPVHRKDASSLPICLPKCWQPRDCLSLGIDRLASAGRVLAPIGNQPPPQWIERHLVGLMIAPDDEELLARRTVPARRVIAHPAVAHIHAVDKRVSKGPAALNDTSAHGSNIGL